MSKVLKISKDYLEELISFESSKIVGKIMKRFEIIADTKILKKDVKELIYESFRDFKGLLVAHNKGIDITVFEFKKPKKEKKNLT